MKTNEFVPICLGFGSRRTVLFYFRRDQPFVANGCVSQQLKASFVFKNEFNV